MKHRALTLLAAAALCLVATAAWADLNSTPATLSVTTANSEAQIGSWVCPGFATNIPLKVRWLEFNTLQFNSSSSYTNGQPSPVWVTLGAFSKTTEQVVGSTMAASIAVSGTVSGVSSFTVTIKYDHGSPSQSATRQFTPTVKFGCNKV